MMIFFFFSSRRRHTRWTGDWSSDVCSSDLEHGEQANPGDREREPGAEGNDQQQAEGHSVQRDRSEQDDKRRGARKQTARDADGEERPTGRAVLLMMMAVVMPEPVPPARAQHRGADRDHKHTGDEVQPRVKPFRNDELRQRERDESEPEDA